MKGVEIVEMECLREHERGSDYVFPNRESRDISVIKRKKGTVSGEHHHEGKNIQKDPEIIILLEGELEIYFKNPKTGEELCERYSRPMLFKISPNVYHKVTAITDIVFVEFGSPIEGEIDVVKGMPEKN